MELEIINKLFLELSQIATAKTKKELLLESAIKEARLHTYQALMAEDAKDVRTLLVAAQKALRSVDF